MVRTHCIYFKSQILRSSKIVYKVFFMTVNDENSNNSWILDFKNSNYGNTSEQFLER